MSPTIGLIWVVVAVSLAGFGPATIVDDAGPASRGGDSRGVPADRLALLERGVNLPHWFVYAPKQSLEHTRWYITGADFKLLRGAGLTHVRLPVDPAYIWDEKTESVRGENAAEVLRAIDLALGEGLAVVFDPHGAAEWGMPDAATRRSETLEKYWGAVAPLLEKTDPARVFLEVRNEPANIKDPSLWPTAQAGVVKVIRRGAPHHTIIATGDEWGGIDGLMRLARLTDDNVVYSFHFYTPHNFTHQGATWGTTFWRHLHGLPYPAAGLGGEAVDRVLAGIEEQPAKDIARSYFREGWDAAKILAEIGRAKEWSRKAGAPVYCGEFGVYRLKAPAESRAAWLRDVVSALRANNIGWAMWDYSGGFALTNGEPGHRTLDAPTSAALGLQSAK